MSYISRLQNKRKQKLAEFSHTNPIDFQSYQIVNNPGSISADNMRPAVSIFLYLPISDERHILPNYDTTALFYGSYAYQYDRESAARNYGWVDLAP